MSENNKMPDGWVWSTLGDVCIFFQGYGFPKNLQGQGIGEYPFYKVGDISKNVQAGNTYLEFCENHINEDILKKLKAKVSPRNTIVFAKIGEALKLNRRALIKQPGIVDNNAIGLKADDNICNDSFLFYFLSRLKLENYSRATTVPSVRKTDIEAIEIPIPPRNEQQRIVAKIEELFSSLDKGIESLKTAQQQLKVYRQAVLKWAFEGRLTNKNVVDGELPKSWRRVKFIDFCKLQRGYDLPLKSIIPGIYPVVTSSGVHGYHNEYKAIGPCLITGRSGGVGNIHYVDVEKYWPHNTVLFVKEFCNNYPKYVYYYFLQFNFKGFSASTTIPTLDRKQLYNELVPLAPYREQQDIVAEIESRLSVCDKIEESIEQSLKQSEALRQSILKKAFEGKLVPQDPNDEPASKLLEHIRTARQKQAAEQRNINSKRRRSDILIAP